MLAVISPPVAWQVAAAQSANALGHMVRFREGVGVAMGVADAFAVGIGLTRVELPPESPPHAIAAIDSAIKKPQYARIQAVLPELSKVAPIIGTFLRFGGRG
ncbi:MAG TPA: hypothetical protein VNE82_13340 [Candidatus Binataceae bacterium]|nr:hypothetical protein [Candidatus Binataceae bacterium]